MARLADHIFDFTVLSFTMLVSLTTMAQHISDEETIENTYNDWVDAVNDKDLDRWVTFLAPDPLFLPPNNPALRGEKSVREYYAHLFTDNLFSLDCQQQRVVVAESKDMAWSTGVCKSMFTGPDGNTASGSSKWAKVWIRMPDGSWKCTLNSWNMNGSNATGD
jgi:uncharacterized protein (TIGR02246 family)